MRKTFLTTLLLSLILIIPSFGQNSALTKDFELAAAKYQIPVDILKAVSYAETRFYNVSHDDISCTGAPQVYGIMGLRNDDWFGHSLLEGAALIGKDPQAVATDIKSNIFAAAALLKKYADESNIDQNNLNSWKSVIEKYSGIPQSDIKPFYSFDVFKVLSEGTETNGVEIQKHREMNMAVFGDDVNPKNKLKNIENNGAVSSPNSTASEDYDKAVWDPSPNYTANAVTPEFLVVHDTEGGFAGSLSWLKNPQAQASSHYIIRSSDGYIVQLVREKDRAWHARCWNAFSMGVEHEGYVANPAYFTDAMYKSSAALYKHFVEKYGIPVNRNRIIGHFEWQHPAWVSWVKQNYPAMDPTCNSHTDPGQYWDWNYYFTLIEADSTAPEVIAYSPADPADSVWANEKVVINFNKPMNNASTEAAFSISPSVDGNFTWEDHDKTLIFTPTSLYNLAQVYTVTIADSAISLFNAKLDSTYSFSFVTRSFSELNVENSYPEINGKNISTSLKVITTFNTPLLSSTLAGNILFQDSTGASVSIKNATYFDEDGKGVVTFLPLVNLQPNAVYKLTFKKGLKNIVGTELGTDYIINFTTMEDNFVKGTVVDSFESIGNWHDPEFSGSTIGTDPAATTFDISGEQKIDGTSSGKISYTFTGTGGVCRVYNGSKPSVGDNDSSRVGLWVNGDLSNNYLEFWFYYNSNQNVSVRVDTLNWTGWKFVDIPLSAVNGTGEKLFHSVVIKQNDSGKTSGTIYIDGEQVYNPTLSGVEGNNFVSVPGQYKLEQNYPNPFNPSTIIQYQIPENNFVTLKVYDVLGREVATLVNEQKNAGTYRVEFNAGQLNLTSGVYFYTIKSGNFTETKKLMLMK